MGKNKREVRKLDMREYIEYHLDLFGLGKLVSVKGPKPGGKNQDMGWWCIDIVYRPPGNETVHDIQYYDKYIEVYLGYSREGGYWNRRNIRIEIEKEAKRRREEQNVEQVWKRAQLSLTAGPSARNSDGAFEL